MAEEKIKINTSDLVEIILSHAIKERASDIHFEPQREGFSIRMRVDGILHSLGIEGKPSFDQIIQRIKILADLDITETRKSQDGHFEYKDASSNILLNVRVSLMPTIYGEAAVLRLLNRQDLVLDLADLGFDETQLEQVKELAYKNNGMVVVSGPSGSGKTTLLYSILNLTNQPGVNIVTLEDPVEYQFTGVRQTQINPKIDITFSSGLRALLRQDPDIMLVGEIRDQETAEIASRAALTGHLLLTTVHANDAVGVIIRLNDMGIGKATIASSISGIISRRLIRKICPHCAEFYKPNQHLLERLNISPDNVKTLTLKRGRGCVYCKNTGYLGRTGIHEILIFDDELRSFIIEGISYLDMIKKVRQKGFLSLREDGVKKVLRGITTVEEVIRVTE
jgi:type II secretory ATPase GspE/PulE/Tfp pilus assembly ATPase PilB-like protein